MLKAKNSRRTIATAAPWQVRPRLWSFMVLFISLLFSLFIMEMSVRIFYEKPPRPMGHHQAFMEYDPLLGWRKVRNLTNHYTSSEFTVVESINSKGIRGMEYQYEKADNEYRILVLGDSFAEGQGVEFHQLFSEILKAEMNRSNAGKHIEVINAGTAGYSTDQELLFYQTEGRKYQPDLIILAFFDNDVWFNNQPVMWCGYKPLFQRTTGNMLRLTNVPPPKPGMRDHSAQEAMTAEPKGWDPIDSVKGWLGKRSYLYALIRDRVKKTARLQRVAIRLGLIRAPTGIAEQTEIIPVPDEFRIYQKKPSEAVEAAWTITEALIRSLKEEAGTTDSNLLIFYIPQMATVHRENWNVIKKQFDVSDEDWDLEQVETRLLNICVKHGIDCMATVSAFKTKAAALRRENQRLYYRMNQHWNPEGHRLAGELLTDHILNAYIKERDEPS